VTETLKLLDHASRDDLRVFFERLLRAGEPEVRLVTHGATLGVFGCTQSPVGLLDKTDVVLVNRGFTLSEAPETDVDVTVAARAMLDRMARMGVVGLKLELPANEVSSAWAGVLPPVGGWEPAGVVDATSLAEVAHQGIQRVADAMPREPGEPVARAVRSRVWGAEIAPGLPAAAAFAAESMGFLNGEDHALLAQSRTWLRLSTTRGQVIVRKKMG